MHTIEAEASLLKEWEKTSIKQGRSQDVSSILQKCGNIAVGQLLLPHQIAYPPQLIHDRFVVSRMASPMLNQVPK